MNTDGQILAGEDALRAFMSEKLRSQMVELSEMQAKELASFPQEKRVQHYADHFQSVGIVGSKMLKELIRKSRK